MFYKEFIMAEAAINFANKFSLADIFTNGNLFFVVPISEWAEDTEARFLYEGKASLYRDSLREDRRQAFDNWLAVLPYCFIDGKKVYCSLGFPKKAAGFVAINNFVKKGGKLYDR